jgi:hypothetical protein
MFYPHVMEILFYKAMKIVFLGMDGLAPELLLEDEQLSEKLIPSEDEKTVSLICGHQKSDPDLIMDEPFSGSSLFIGIQEFAMAELYQNSCHPSSHPVAHENLSSINAAQWQSILLDDQMELYIAEDAVQRTNLASVNSSNSVIASLRQELNQNLLLASKR